MTPMPPACAMAIAISASVTVSMAEAMIGMLSAMSRVMRRADIDFGGQHVGQAGLQQHVVEGQRLARGAVGIRLGRFGLCHCQLYLMDCPARLQVSRNLRGWRGSIARRVTACLSPAKPAFLRLFTSHGEA